MKILRLSAVVYPCAEVQILLCKRGIGPRYRLWTLPAGFMENGETTRETDGARNFRRGRNVGYS